IVRSSVKFAVCSVLNVLPVFLIVALVDKSTMSMLENELSAATPLRSKTQDSPPTSPPEAVSCTFVKGAREELLRTIPAAGVSEARETLKVPVEVVGGVTGGVVVS